MKLYTYLNYGGNCRQAFEFYAEHLGGKITMLTTHGDVLRPTLRDAARPVRHIVDAAARATDAVALVR